MSYALFAGLVAVGTIGAASSATMQAKEPTLAQVRAAAAKYQDVKAALADGYIQDPSGMCETAAMMGKPAKLGAMGLHYFRPDLLGITAPPNPRVDGTSTYTDFHKPAVLLYEPQADGSLKLVGVENLVFEKAWRAAGHKSPPSFHGVPFDHMVDNPKTKIDEAHGFMPHYDRHVWVFRHNPDGVYAQYNPTVTCRYAKLMKMGNAAAK